MLDSWFSRQFHHCRLSFNRDATGHLIVAKDVPSPCIAFIDVPHISCGRVRSFRAHIDQSKIGVSSSKLVGIAIALARSLSGLHKTNQVAAKD
jgi:hypothetical protein